MTNYFYADDEVAIYDQTVLMTDPHYGELHITLNEFFCRWISTEARLIAPHLPVVLDIGCGTGEEAIRLLKSSTDLRLIAIDCSSRMLNVLAEKLAYELGNITADGRCKIACVDVREKGWITRALEVAKEDVLKFRFDAVISAYALHHLDAETKRRVYGEIFQQLSPRGIFANADLFAFETKWLADYAQKTLEDWIVKQFSDPTAPHYFDASLLPQDRQRLMENWIYHVRKENQLLPALPSTLHTKDWINPVCEQSLLAEVGFSATECIYRSGQSAILWATKE